MIRDQGAQDGLGTLLNPFLSPVPQPRTRWLRAEQRRSHHCPSVASKDIVMGEGTGDEDFGKFQARMRKRLARKRRPPR